MKSWYGVGYEAKPIDPIAHIQPNRTQPEMTKNSVHVELKHKQINVANISVQVKDDKWYTLYIESQQYKFRHCVP